MRKAGRFADNTVYTTKRISKVKKKSKVIVHSETNIFYTLAETLRTFFGNQPVKGDCLTAFGILNGQKNFLSFYSCLIYSYICNGKDGFRTIQGSVNSIAFTILIREKIYYFFLELK